MRNNYRKLMENIPVPEGLEPKVLWAARKQETVRSKRGRWRPVLRGAVCAACALALVLGTVHLGPAEESGEQPGMPVMTLDYAFGLTAYAADTGETVRPNANGGLALMSGTGWADEAHGNYTGCLFQIAGEDIRGVSVSIDRGGLYRSETRTGLGKEEVRSLLQQQERGEVVCSVYGDSEDSPKNAEVMTALGDSFTEDYDAAVSYGFWAPEYQVDTDPDADMRQASWDSIDTFDGAELAVKVTFADGSQQSETYRLSTGRLKVVYESDGTRTVLPTLAGDEDLWGYGVYAVSESESRWLQWPVQGSNTVSLSYPYGAAKNGAVHSGIDIPASQGAVILAAADGAVTETGFDTAKGNYLVLDHGDGLTTLYAHCRNVDVKEGDMVKAGEMVAAVGATGMATGPHLHFEVRQDGQAQNPIAYFDSDIRDTLRAEKTE